MTVERTQAITRERLELWENQLASYTATPLILIGLSQGGPVGGTIQVCTVDGVSDKFLATVLRVVADQLDPAR